MKFSFLLARTVLFSLSLSLTVPLAAKCQKHSDSSSSCHSKVKKVCCIKKPPCEEPIAISKVPFCADRPGKYCVTKDLVFFGAGNAIVVKANGVTINFAGHDLLLQDLSATGIFAEGVQELRIENDKIFTQVPSRNGGSRAIHLVSCEKVTLDNVFTKNTSFGVFLQSCEDVFITHSRFADHLGGPEFIVSGSGITAENSSQLIIEESTFSGGSVHQVDPPVVNEDDNQLVLNTCTECRVTNCEFLDSNTAIFAPSIDGLTVENTLFDRGASTFGITNFLGFFGEDFQARNIIYRNCSFQVHKAPVALCNAILPVHGAGLLVENCIFEDSVPAAFNCTFLGTIGTSAGDLGSDTAFPFDDVTIRNCDVKCECINGIEIGPGHNFLIEGCRVSGGAPAFLEEPPFHAITLLKINNPATDVTVVNNSFHTGFNLGIFLQNDLYSVGQGTSSNIVFKENVISGCASHGIVVEPNFDNVVIQDNKVVGNGEDGIKIEMEANDVLLQGNEVFGNVGTGINNLGSNTTTFFNTSCNNDAGNCQGVSPAKQPGDNPVVGSNICCN